MIKVDRNNRGRVYVGGKWHKDVSQIDMHAEPWTYTVKLVVLKRDKGCLVVEDNEIATEKKVFRLE